MPSQCKPSKETASAGSEAAQLRRDIDSGTTGDKVGWPDPAAAPLGTDDEAAGTPHFCKRDPSVPPPRK